MSTCYRNVHRARARGWQAALVGLLLAGCASPDTVIRPAAYSEPTQAEFVTYDQFREAQDHAARLGGFDLPERRPMVMILHEPIERLCELNGGKCPHAALHVAGRYGSTLYFRDDRPWQSDQGHHFGILVHEALHSLQPADMPACERELQAHTIQAAWLDEQGEHEMAENIRQDARKACVG